MTLRVYRYKKSKLYNCDDKKNNCPITSNNNYCDCYYICNKNKCNKIYDQCKCFQKSDKIFSLNNSVGVL